MSPELMELRRKANRNLARLASGEVKREQEAARQAAASLRKHEADVRRWAREDRAEWRAELKTLRARLREIERDWDVIEQEMPMALEELDAERDTLWERERVLVRKLEGW